MTTKKSKYFTKLVELIPREQVAIKLKGVTSIQSHCSYDVALSFDKKARHGITLSYKQIRDYDCEQTIYASSLHGGYLIVEGVS